MPLLTELELVWATNYKDAAPTALAKNGLVAGSGGVTVEPAMKMLSRPMRYWLAVVEFMPMKTGNFPRNHHIKISLGST
jgi:hypothetical protein